VELVERAIAARREYENSLRALHAHYTKAGDKKRLDWAQQELMAYHLMFKPSYNLDVKDVPPADLVPESPIPEANELYRVALSYKDRGFGNDYILNQRRAEVLFREILEKYKTSDKIAEVAYQLGELYESKAYRQYDRAAKYYERSAQWVKGSRTDALMRAATLYDRQVNDRVKAIEMYRAAISRDVDPDRIQQAERRLAELTGQRR
jgi:TolA-binding protein